MSFLWKIIFRNILRNRRRSLMTGSAVAAGAMAMLLFGGYVGYIFAGLQTGSVQQNGHLTVFRSGYFLFGPGNPAGYGIDRYQDVMGLIGEDPVLKPMINVLTPTQSLVGIAGNFSGSVDASKTFLGEGFIPSDRDRMRQWDEFHTGATKAPEPGMTDGDMGHGLVGFGLARMLGLCGPLKLANCPPAPATKDAAPDRAASTVNKDLVSLAQQDNLGGAAAIQAEPQLDLLAATAGGTPNVVSLSVAGVERQGVRELDDNFIALNLGLAQQLVYGRGEHKATGIVLQLKRSEDMPAARARLAELFKQHKLDLEIKDFADLNPFYGQVVGMFSGIFLFIAMVMGMIVLFAVVNTMTMNVMERTNEIGTTRAMGVRPNGIRMQFVSEGMLIGVLGTAFGTLVAIAIALSINHAGLTWIPPGNANPVPLRVDMFGKPGLMIGTWVTLVLVATLAALIPANRAARLSVVDALRHV
ncbi:MAG TPA: FtsX-like permease family protein [Gammaproteobacteria bacterium]|nr:FtsX-like permease family protein [Gammaproteobacteria bacterium]